MSGCTKAAAPTQTNSNRIASENTNERSQTMIAHSTENQPPPSVNTPSPGTKTKWSQSGDPIDTTELNVAVSNSERLLKAAPSAAAKKTLADAYFKRGFALTEARQYASALGDYRKAIKFDPANAEAKQWIDQILQIYDSMNKEAPKEGEEPPPLPYKKDENQK